MSDTDDLIRLLDPHRDYGPRSFDDVVADVRAGRLRLEPGRGALPVIRDPSTGHPARGTGQPPASQEAEVQRWSRRRFNERAAADLDAVYDALIAAATHGDMRAAKLFFEVLLGRPREALAAADDRTLEVLLALARQTRPSEVVIDVSTLSAARGD